MSKINFNIEIETEDMIEGLSDLSYEEIFHIITRIEEKVADLQFTEELAIHFNEIVKKEHKA